MSVENRRPSLQGKLTRLAAVLLLVVSCLSFNGDVDAVSAFYPYFDGLKAVKPEAVRILQ